MNNSFVQLIKCTVVILYRTNPESYLANSSSKISISSDLFSLVAWDASFSEHALKIGSITMITKTEAVSLRRSVVQSSSSLRAPVGA